MESPAHQECVTNRKIHAMRWTVPKGMHGEIIEEAPPFGGNRVYYVQFDTPYVPDLCAVLDYEIDLITKEES